MLYDGTALGKFYSKGEGKEGVGRPFLGLGSKSCMTLSASRLCNCGFLVCQASAGCSEFTTTFWIEAWSASMENNSFPMTNALQPQWGRARHQEIPVP